MISVYYVCCFFVWSFGYEYKNGIKELDNEQHYQLEIFRINHQEER